MRIVGRGRLPKGKRLAAMGFISMFLAITIQSASAGGGGYEDDIGWNGIVVAYVCADAKPNVGTPCKYGGGHLRVKLIP